MHENETISIREAIWSADEALLMAIRTEVFVVEQNVPEDIERDEWDPKSRHVLVFDEKTGSPIGTGRLLPDGHIGRVAVLKSWRGTGVGAWMMNVLIEMAREAGMPVVELSAQTQALAFYQRLGFIPYGKKYMEAGIEHIAMRLDLQTA